jgi:hypothetical protein
MHILSLLFDIPVSLNFIHIRGVLCSILTPETDYTDGVFSVLLRYAIQILG